MSILGKVVGGTIGFALGGPLGAIAGAAFGHAFDVSEHQYLEDGRPTGRLSTGENAQFTFFVATFSMLAKLARADGRVTPEELASIEKFMLYDLNLNPQSRQVAMNIFHTAAQSPQRFEDFANQFYVHFRGQPQLLDMMIDIMLRVAMADGSLSENEERLILAAARIFQFSDTQYAQIRSRYVSETEKDYAILDCKPTDSDEVIKRQYRKKVSEFHPDKIAGKGLPDEFIQFASDKFREIQEAYDEIKRARGMK